MLSVYNWARSTLNYYLNPPPNQHEDDFPQFVLDIINIYLKQNEISQMDTIRLNQFLQENYPEMFVVRDVFDFLKKNLVHIELSQLVNVVYGDKNDHFHQMISNLLQALVQKKLSNNNKDFFIDLKNPHSVYSILFEILLFKENFPDIYNLRKYEKERALLEKICAEYQIPYKSRLEDLFLARSTANIQNIDNKKTLVLGCGPNIAAKGQCGGHDQNKTVFLDCDPTTDADVIGDYYARETWNHLPSDHFEHVLFEGFLPSPSLSSLRELRRTLKNGGKVLMHFNHPILRLLKKEDGLKEFFICRCKFTSYTVKDVELKTCNKSEIFPMIELIK